MKIIKKDFEYRLKIIGANLQAIRTARKESIQVVSNAVQISDACLEIIEKAEYDMELVLLIDLCHYYKVNVADVISEGFQYPDK